MSALPSGDLADVDHITLANMEKHDHRPRVCPDWRKENAISIGLHRLSNNVHPAFEVSRFVAPHFSLQDTQQARRFASRLLDADCSIPFWWTLMSGDNDEDPRLEDVSARAARMTPQKIWNAVKNSQQQPSSVLDLPAPPISEFRPAALKPQQIAQTKAKLRQLAQQVHHLAEVDADGSRCDTDWFSRATPPFRGSPNSIVISAKELRAHSAAMEGDLICQAWASISLGFRLLQLLAHAAIGAAHTGPECNWSNQYRFSVEPKPGAQIRMLESCTFGGVLRREQEQNHVAKSHYTINGAEGVRGLWLAFSDFPGEDEEVMSGTIPKGLSISDTVPGEYGPHYHREWKVSFSWLLRLMTDTFWNKDVRTRGQRALTPPKEVAYVMHRDSKRKYGPLHSEFIRRRGIVPHGYRMLPRSCVMAKKSLRHDGCGNAMFGGFDVGRIIFGPNDEMYREGEESSESEGNGSESNEPDMANAASYGEDENGLPIGRLVFSGRGFARGDNDGDTESDIYTISSESGIEMDSNSKSGKC